MSEELNHILGLAAAMREAENSPQWRIDLEGAMERHGSAVEALHEALYAALDQRGEGGDPVPAAKPATDPLKAAKKKILADLRATLPQLVRKAIDEINP